MAKYYLYDGKEVKKVALEKEVRNLFYLKRCKEKPIVVFHGLCANPVEKYRVFEITPEGLKQLTGSRWHFIPYEVFMNEKAVKMNWKDYIE
jgi:hypothetical protein